MIRKVAYLICLLAAMSLAGATARAQGYAEEAEAAYRAGDYAKAKAAWTALLAERGEDARIEFDLGNCEYRLGDHARALWRFERAKRGLGADERVLFNLALAERALGLQGSQNTSFFADLRARFRNLDAASWFWLGLSLEVAGLLVLALALRKRWRGVAFAASLCAVLGAFALARAATIEPDRVIGVVILEDGTALRAEPRSELAPLMKLSAGVRATYLASSPGWVRVRIQDREGWVERRAAGEY